MASNNSDQMDVDTDEDQMDADKNKDFGFPLSKVATRQSKPEDPVQQNDSDKDHDANQKNGKTEANVSTGAAQPKPDNESQETHPADDKSGVDSKATRVPGPGQLSMNTAVSRL